MTGWGFTDRPSLVINNAVFRGMVGGSGAKAAIVTAIETNNYIPHREERIPAIPRQHGLRQLRPAFSRVSGLITRGPEARAKLVK